MLLRLLVILLAVSPTVGCSRDQAPPTPLQASDVLAAPAPARSLTPVSDASQVCMVNNMFFGKTQIPVPVDGKMYWGCCEGCKTRLGTDPASRVANDPVTGEVVDKATAVMAYDRTGAVLYFASAENLSRYQL